MVFYNLRLFIMHFILTDRGKDIEMDEKLRAKFQYAQQVLSISAIE